MKRFDQFLPVQFRSKKSLLAVRVGNSISRFGSAELREAGEFVSPPLGHGTRQISLEVTEIQKGRTRSKFLTHKKQRNLWREQQNFHSGFHRGFGRNVQNACAKGPVADLIVILQKRNEG